MDQSCARSRRVRPAHVDRRTVALAAAGAGACALAAWAAIEWTRLKRTPALSDASAHAGITVRYTRAGPYRMFSRHASCSGGHAQRLPVVLVHGLVISSRYMEPLALALHDDFDVHAPDLPGFGESALRGRALPVAGWAACPRESRRGRRAGSMSKGAANGSRDLARAARAGEARRAFSRRRCAALSARLRDLRSLRPRARATRAAL
ncbi:Alpha/beta hydrolase family protein [Caballeronia ptereochthonis]|uniref:Alpha/beta hydrolase family protein n=1 Tax=Caballeronia ptereochthonis TaxID=1777144 RepID=A0A158AI72_9BURK|nr:Alpha/beta hydrolase family protein [Caballeronia ptereochthonis]